MRTRKSGREVFVCLHSARRACVKVLQPREKYPLSRRKDVGERNHALQLAPYRSMDLSQGTTWALLIVLVSFF